MLDSSVFVHPTALCETDLVGPGTRIWAFAHVMAGAVVGRDCNICDHVFVEGGARIGDRVTVKNNALVWDKVTIEDEVFVGPNVVFTNDLVPRIAFKHVPEQFLPTMVRKGATLGANSTVLCGITIGEHAFVGAAAVVVADVPPYVLVLGNPARPAGFVCECGQKLSDPYLCVCGRRYERRIDGGLCRH